MSRVNNDRFISYFPNPHLSLFLSYCLKTLTTYICGKNRDFCLVPDFNESASNVLQLSVIFTTKVW